MVGRPIPGTGMTRNARIVAVDYSLPERILTNGDLERLHPSWNMPEVAKRTGVQQRHIASSDETALDLAVDACRRVVGRTGTKKIDAIIFCTQTPDQIMPPNSCLLQTRLGLPTRTLAYDFSLACSGYVYGLFMAKSFIVSNAVDRVLLVTADTYSKLIHPDDRATMTLFGDGAAATLIEAGEPGIGEFVMGTDGSQGSCFEVPAGGARLPRSCETAVAHPDRHGNRRSLENIHMDGPGVLAFVQREVPPAVQEVLDRGAVRPSDVDLVILHQASKMASDYLERVLDLPRARFFSNIESVGNTVSASIPMAIRDAELAGILTKGMKVLLVGFGVGLSWGVCVVDW